MRHLLNTGKLIPKFDRVYKTFVVICLLAPFGLAVSFRTFIEPVTMLLLSTMILIPCGAIICAFKRQRSAIFFLAAFSLFCLGGIMIGLRALGIIPSNSITTNGLQLGSAVEMMVLAFALADRYNVIRREKAKVQREALESQKLLVDNLLSAERLLESRVAERTDELNILNRKLESLSTTDGLTGVANRRRFDEVLVTEWGRAARLNQPLALAMIDVDWFKKFNDHYGHQAGDECLRTVARIIAAKVCRSGDLIARYGGEEFAFIAPVTDSASALNIAQEVCVSYY